MLVIIAILLIFGVVVRQNWRNSAAKREQILRLVVTVSEEEAEIAKLQADDRYDSPPQPPPPQQQQLEKRYYCAVCYCPTTTRCARCKAVRYCSGKCQIIHWRQGHKDDCRPATSLHASKASESVVEAALENQDEMNLNGEVKSLSDRAQEHDDSGSSTSSLPMFSSSTEQSETSFDGSTSEVPRSRSPIWPDKASSVGIDSHPRQTTSDPDEADVPTVSPSEDFVLSSSSPKTSSSAENHRSQAQPSNGKKMKSMYCRGSGNHQVSKVELRNSKCSKSMGTSSSDEYWKNEAQMFNGKETRPMSFSLENAPKMSTKTGTLHASLSEIQGVQMLSQPTSKGLKTSVQKFVQHFRVSKQPRSYTVDTGKDPSGNYNHKIIFPLQLFVQLYSCDAFKLHPFGLVNCGNSCYANAVLQCLTFTRPITSYLLQGLHSKTCRKRGWCLICEFELLIRKGQQMNSALSPVGILSQIHRIGSHLSHGREEDAHDFLRNMIDTMQSIWLEEAGVSGPMGEDSTLLGLTFGGYLRSKIKCMKCSGRSEQCDRMMDLTVEIDGDIRTLEEALAQFTISETLGGDDKYKCSRCQSYQKAQKKLTVLHAPNILTIVLKRFRSGNSGKLNKLVQFPEILNLDPYMSRMSDKYHIYHLYAVVVHLNMMNSAYTGHYISYVKDLRGEWFRIDDTRVSHVDVETVLSVEAYILFYARNTPRCPSSLMSNVVYSDGKTKRDVEAISSNSSTKKRSSKLKPSLSDWYKESTMLHQRSERDSFWMPPPNDFRGNHMLDHEDWGSHNAHINPILDSTSDSSSIFSASDAGSYSTDSTKDSSADDVSGYVFGSSFYHP